jgi:dihydrofolate synthase/folylpolyglutamate synthase
VRTLAPVIDEWFAATSQGPRAIDSLELARRAATVGVTMQPAGTIEDALERAARVAEPSDRVVVFGSFHTVGPALVALRVPL